MPNLPQFLKLVEDLEKAMWKDFLAERGHKAAAKRELDAARNALQKAIRDLY